MGGSNKVIDTTPQDVQGLRQQLVSYLGNGGGNPTGAGGGSLPGQSGMSPGGNGGLPPGLSTLFRTTGSPSGMVPGGPQPSTNPLDRINAGPVAGGGYVGDQATPTLNQVDPVTGQPRSAIGNVSSQNIGTGSDPWNQISGLISQYQQSVAGQNGGQPSPLGYMTGGAMPGQVNAQMAAAPGTQSVDQLGGANSEFFKNMVAQLQPSFTSQRAGDLAQAKEAMGKLTGSGAGNALGASTNRSLGAEQATLANYATTGIQQELQRQIANQQVGAQQNIAQFQGQNAANMQTQQGGINQILSLLGYNNQRDLQTQQLGSQAGIANMNNIASLTGQTGANLTNLAGTNADLALRGGMANQTADQNWVAQMNQLASGNADRGQAANNLLAQLRQQTGAQNQSVAQGAATNQFNTNAGIAQSNAANFMALLNAMTQGGVAPSTVVHTPGLGETLGNIAGTAVGAYVGKHA